MLCSTETCDDDARESLRFDGFGAGIVLGTNTVAVQSSREFRRSYIRRVDSRRRVGVFFERSIGDEPASLIGVLGEDFSGEAGGLSGT